MIQNTESEAKRIESLWSGEFGDDYTQRNAAAGNVREAFWNGLLKKYPVKSALEVGCNLGANLTWIAKQIPPHQTFGVDINDSALQQLRLKVPGVNAVCSAARQLPFRDRWFDLVFTMGVLIHQPPDLLPLAMAEIVRCSNRYVFCGEYFAEQPTEVKYRGHERALFKRDFGGLYQSLFPELNLVEKGFLDKAKGWDDITYWLFERPA